MLLALSYKFVLPKISNKIFLVNPNDHLRVADEFWGETLILCKRILICLYIMIALPLSRKADRCAMIYATRGEIHSMDARPIDG